MNISHKTLRINKFNLSQMITKLFNNLYVKLNFNNFHNIPKIFKIKRDNTMKISYQINNRNNKNMLIFLIVEILLYNRHNNTKCNPN